MTIMLLQFMVRTIHIVCWYAIPKLYETVCVIFMCVTESKNERTNRHTRLENRS
jgi:hypothetical protein